MWPCPFYSHVCPISSSHSDNREIGTTGKKLSHPGLEVQSAMTIIWSMLILERVCGFSWFLWYKQVTYSHTINRSSTRILCGLTATICHLAVSNMEVYYVIKVAILSQLKVVREIFSRNKLDRCCCCFPHRCVVLLGTRSSYSWEEIYKNSSFWDLDTQNGSVELVVELTSLVCRECQYGKPRPRLPRRRVPLLWMCLIRERGSKKLGANHFVDHSD